MQSNNPYEPPPLDVDWLVMRRRAIPVGREEIHTVIVQTSLSRGLKTHTVDAAGEATPIQRGPCCIQIGERERHQVEVELDAMHRVNVLVDGKLVEGDLFPRMRTTIFAVVIGFILVTTVTVTLGVVLLVRFLGH
ncbi:hypothetical protein SH528x_002019 [Novipirellula sp. SH528]|uniref:hypothetical protein n=1 Tax=Novipirellula sp. SH528 TaxID=3454466 RepID=UPI003FA0C47E